MAAPRSASMAFLLTAPLAIGIWIGCLMAYTILVHGQAQAFLLTPYMITGGILFGLPIVTLALAFLAVPSFLFLRWRRRVTLPAAVMVGAVIGLLARGLVAAELGQPEVRFLPLPVAVSAGVLSALAWWRLWTGSGAAWPRGRGTV